MANTGSKSSLKRWMSIALSIVMVIGLMACGGGSGKGKEDYKKAFVGKWEAREMIGSDEDDTVDEDMMQMLKEMGMTISLSLLEDGTGSLEMMGETCPVIWGATGEGEGKGSLEDEGKKENFVLKMKDGRLSLIQDETGMIFEAASGAGTAETEGKDTKGKETKEKESKGKKPLTAGKDSAEKGIQEYWNGDYYGYWEVRSGEGYWAGFEDVRYDCMGRIKLGADGKASMVIWDQDLPLNDPVSETVLTITAQGGISENGAAVSESGYFMDGQIGHADWIIDPATVEQNKAEGYKHFIEILGDYNSDGEELSYAVYMKPWGERWDDVAAKKKELPAGYYDWYLPMIEAGKSMPDTFEGAEAGISGGSEGGALAQMEPMEGAPIGELGYFDFAATFVDCDINDEGKLFLPYPDNILKREDGSRIVSLDSDIYMVYIDIQPFPTKESLQMAYDMILDISKGMDTEVEEKKEKIGTFEVQEIIESNMPLGGAKVDYYISFGKKIGGYEGLELSVECGSGENDPNDLAQCTHQVIRDMIAKIHD